MPQPTRRSLLTAAAVAVPAAWLAGGQLPAFADSFRHTRSRGLGDAGAADTAGVALAWHDITDQTVTAAAFPEPVTQSRTWAVSWLAAARATKGVSDSSYATAALAQALHDTLAAQVPARQAALDGSLASTLASVADGPRKTAGIAAGKAAAAQTLKERDGDGLDTASVDIAWTPPAAAPGVFQLTPPVTRAPVRAGQGNARPFLLKSNDQFDPGAPYSISSAKYLADLAEVREIGGATSTRTDQQTETALFYYPALNFAHVETTRALVAAGTQASISALARFVAIFNVISTDTQIATLNAKYKYLFWRPFTAITTGSVDQDPSWTSYQVAPQHPEYPSGHGAQAGSQQGVLEAIFGPRTPVTISLTSPNAAGVTRTYDTWQAITDDVVDARVWEGIHYRTSDEVGADLGYRVARWEVGQIGRLGI